MSDPRANVAETELPASDAASPRRFTLDLVSSYALTAVRVGSNVAILAILYRYTNERYAAMYAVVRSMLILLTYLFGGINPALQRLLAVPFARTTDATAIQPPAEPTSSVPTSTLWYSSKRERIRRIRDEADIFYAHANLLASLAVLVLIIPVLLYSENVSDVHANPLTRPWHAETFAGWFALGMLFRLWSEPSAAILQLRNRLALDNLIQIVAELAWVGMCLSIAIHYPPGQNYGGLFAGIGSSFCLAAIGLLIARRFFASRSLGVNLEPWLDVRWRLLGSLLSSAGVISLGQLADFLYAPANILLINSLIAPSAVAQYVPALQIDAGLLLLVGAVSTVLLPRAMSAWARGDMAFLRTTYLRATFACLIVLAAAAVVVAVLVEPVLRMWLGTVPADAPMLTRLVLIHTVVGGTAGVGRAVLLGMGRFKAYSLSALIGGIANVSLALIFVLGFDLGVRGIVYATILAVTARCALWMPWYILRCLRQPSIS